MEDNSKRLNLLMSASLLEEIKVFAKKHDTNTSHVVRIACKKYLEAANRVKEPKAEAKHGN